MTKYHCPRCNINFFKKEVNINQQHGCGEFAHVEWGTEYEGVAEGEVAAE